MSARYLRVVPDDERSQPITFSSGRAVVVSVGQRYTLGLFDGLAAFVALDDAADTAIAVLDRLRTNAVHVVGQRFDLLIDQAHRERGT